MWRRNDSNPFLSSKDGSINGQSFNVNTILTSNAEEAMALRRLRKTNFNPYAPKKSYEKVPKIQGS